MESTRSGASQKQNDRKVVRRQKQSREKQTTTKETRGIQSYKMCLHIWVQNNTRRQKNDTDEVEPTFSSTNVVPIPPRCCYVTFPGHCRCFLAAGRRCLWVLRVDTVLQPFPIPRNKPQQPFSCSPWRHWPYCRCC